jgi:RHS repeat-associated protein
MIAIGADIPSQRDVSSSLQPPASSLCQTGGSVVYVQMDQQTIADYPVGGAATTPTFRYVYASYIDEPVVRKGPTSTSTVHFYHRNQQYSVTAMTTSTGSIAERYAYTAYGQPTILNASGAVISATTLSNRYTYTGREWDSTLGLHDFRARWMSPSAGRFLGRDPIGYKDGVSLYRINISLASLDPEGLAWIDADPTSTNGVEWCLHNFPRQPRRFIHGDTELWHYYVECNCVCCSEKFCDGDVKKIPRCRVVVRLSIKINPLSTWPRDRIYGHEQHHVKKFIAAAWKAKRLLDQREMSAGCMDAQLCPDLADKWANEAQRILSDAVFAQARHEDPPPLDNVQYPPINPMPTNAQPTCKSPSEPKPFPDYGCVYRPLATGNNRKGFFQFGSYD